MASASAAQAARSSARPFDYTNAWMWARSWDGMSRLGPDDQRRLPRHAPDVLELLSSHEHRWAWVDYNQLRWKLSLNPRRLAYCVRALRDLGLAEVTVRRARRNVIDIATGDPIGGYGTEVWLRPLASCRRAAEAAGGHSIWVTEEAMKLVRQRGAHGGRRPGAGRKKGVGNEESRSSLKLGAPSENASDRADGPKSRSSIYDLNTLGSDLPEDPSAERKGAQGAPRPRRPGLDSEGSAGGTAPTVDLFDLPPGFEAKPTRLPIPIHLRGPAPKIPALDNPTTYQDGWRTFVPEDADTAVQVAAVIRGYNSAARRVWGDSAPVLFGRGGDVARSRVYPQLVKAAEVLREHDIPPSAWAEWRLRRAKDSGEPKPWGVARVMQPATIHKLRGLWRRQYDGPVRCARLERVHIEQMLRAREASARWEWGEDPPMSTTGWYAQMRRDERARGFDDPLECWPRPRPRARRGAP